MIIWSSVLKFSFHEYAYRCIYDKVIFNVNHVVCLNDPVHKVPCKISSQSGSNYVTAVEINSWILYKFLKKIDLHELQLHFGSMVNSKVCVHRVFTLLSFSLKFQWAKEFTPCEYYSPLLLLDWWIFIFLQFLFPIYPNMGWWEYSHMTSHSHLFPATI